MKTPMRPHKQIYPIFLFLLWGLFLVSAPGTGATPSDAPPAKKTGGVTGDPASKRGVEYGFDKGFQAGKTDKDAGLEPDPKRHEDFNDPEKFYRYEFGSRAHFVNGFKSGFVGGYQKAFGKEVKVSVPGSKASVGAKGESPSGAVAKPAPVPASTGSDAL